ncbi:hypothetical protein, partial [Rhizobium rhizogenes]|uniref:hypothetical protein n=1 Tax=Rhizobium rhizogenes TaxID=359 RepID=UPI001AEDC555
DHNLKAAGSNPAPATNLSKVPVSESPHRGLFAFNITSSTRSCRRRKAFRSARDERSSARRP